MAGLVLVAASRRSHNVTFVDTHLPATSSKGQEQPSQESKLPIGLRHQSRLILRACRAQAAERAAEEVTPLAEMAAAAATEQQRLLTLQAHVLLRKRDGADSGGAAASHAAGEGQLAELRALQAALRCAQTLPRVRSRFVCMSAVPAVWLSSSWLRVRS